MDTEQVELVRSSFARIRPVSEVFSSIFYRKLFEVVPETRRMFTSDLRTQNDLFMEALSFAIASLDRMEEALPTLQPLGARHKNYGATEKHYDGMLFALLWTLEKGLGDAFTPAVRVAWINAYRTITAAMQTS